VFYTRHQVIGLVEYARSVTVRKAAIRTWVLLGKPAGMKFATLARALSFCCGEEVSNAETVSLFYGLYGMNLINSLQIDYDREFVVVRDGWSAKTSHPMEMSVTNI
jgi:hypothetical protein